jgi:hypothetical protein
MMTIVREDIRLYPDIQRGLDASNQPGMLGRSEERIHHFQAWMRRQLDAANPELSVNDLEKSRSAVLDDCVHETLNCHHSQSVAE